MGNKYLNKNTKFQCGNGNAVWFKPQNGDFKVKINGNDALLDNCCLSLIGGPRPGQCNLLPNPATGTPPGTCAATIVSGSWNNNVKVKVGGLGVLSSGCSINCPVGGSIKPFKPTIVALNVDNEATVKSVNISYVNHTDNNQISEGKNSSETAREDSKTNNNTEIESENQKEETKEQEEQEEVQDVEYALCDYKNCDKAKDCKYLKASYCLKETNESINAKELKINMAKDDFDSYAEDSSCIATSLYGSYMYQLAHHHIIPANQCYKPFPEIVKLANFYNYNINNAENGIILPTMNEGYDKHPVEERKKVAFNAMKVIGKQWHKGGHKYSCKVSAKLDSVLSRPFRHYKDAVDECLTEFRNNLSDDVKCRAENYNQQAKEFSDMMDEICQYIEEYLRSFKTEPEESYPFYISKLAFYYAFQDKLSEFEEEFF